MANVLIIGGNRGIGNALVNGYLARGETVWASCRQDSGFLDTDSCTLIPGVDMTTEDGALALAEALRDVRIDLAVINAGILKHSGWPEVNLETVAHQLMVNAVGPLRMAKALVPRMVAGGKLGILTSRMGSLTDNTSGGYYGYRMSKAAVNAMGVSLARDLQPAGIAVALLHPGFVQTDMTGGRGEVTADFAAKGLMERMDALSLENSGTFWHAQGQALPW